MIFLSMCAPPIKKYFFYKKLNKNNENYYIQHGKACSSLMT